MLTDKTGDCITASAYSRGYNGVAHVAAREKAVRDVREVDSFRGRATLFQRLISATKLTPGQRAAVQGHKSTRNSQSARVAIPVDVTIALTIHVTRRQQAEVLPTLSPGMA